MQRSFKFLNVSAAFKLKALSHSAIVHGDGFIYIWPVTIQSEFEVEVLSMAVTSPGLQDSGPISERDHGIATSVIRAWRLMSNACHPASACGLVPRGLPDETRKKNYEECYPDRDRTSGHRCSLLLSPEKHLKRR